MAFVAEDGTGLADANSLAPVAFADAYFADRANAAWAALTPEAKQSNLIKATDYIQSRWSTRFKGVPQFPDVQALAFPRLCINSDGAVPVGIQKAAAEYALRAIAGKLAPDPVVDASGRMATGTRKKVGPIETETNFASEGALAKPALYRSYPEADAYVVPFLKPAVKGVIR